MRRKSMQRERERERQGESIEAIEASIIDKYKHLKCIYYCKALSQNIVLRKVISIERKSKSMHLESPVIGHSCKSHINLSRMDVACARRINRVHSSNRVVDWDASSL
eukprot:scpid6903/ scgid32296/ 